MLLLLIALQLKHFALDFTPLQTPYMFLNKGTYGHPGGLLHAGLHAFATCVLLYVGNIALMTIFAVCAVEFVVHYNMDWAKMRLNALMDWRADKHPQFWTLLGVDQLVHQLTYVWIVWYVFA